MKRYLIVAITTMALLAAFTSGCINPTARVSTSEGTGTLKLDLSCASVNDAAVASIYVTINEIQYNLNGEWVTAYKFDNPQKYDLLEVTGNNFIYLGEFELPAQYYTQIRFILDIPEYNLNPAGSGCYIEFTDKTQKPLVIPSGGETGFKAIGAFAVPVNGTVEVTAHVDVRKTLEGDQNGVYTLKPTISLVVNGQVGNISGSITNGSIYENIIIYAYEDGTWSVREDDEPGRYGSRFPNAVNCGKMNGDGSYTLSLLAAGTYDLVIAGFTGDEFNEVLGFVPDVKIKEGQTTTRNIDVPTPEKPTGLVAFEGNKGILLEWDDNLETDLDGYNVYWSTASGGPYIKIAETTLSKYNENGLVNGLTYYYVVTALDKSGNESTYSTEVSATPSG